MMQAKKKAVDRADEIRQNVEAISDCVDTACRRAGRDRREVTVVAVSKKFSIGDIALANDAGVRDFGENRVQELVEKVDAWGNQYPGRELTWHMVGHLQRNKVRDVIGRAALFHGLDSVRLAVALSARAEEASRQVDCLVQVNVSEESTKFGLAPDDVEATLEEAGGLTSIRIRGFMTLARPTDDPEEVRPEFAKLRGLFERYQRYFGRPMDVLSMGMSGDFEVAIEEGATHIRVGTAIFGKREPA